jgi:RNA polymerase sigma-70 factor (ECF subfamily)
MKLLRNNKNREQFEEIYKTHYAVLRNYANFIVKDREETHDIVHDVFLTLWKEWENITSETSLKAWLFRSIYNKCMDVLKHAEVQSKYADYVSHLDCLMYNESDYPLSDLIESEMLEMLERAIAKLPPQCRNIFIMSRKKGMTHQEIACELNVSANTVHTQIKRALDKIRFEMKDCLPLLLLIIFYISVII